MLILYIALISNHNLLKIRFVMATGLVPLLNMMKNTDI